jgi:hypothetical protein
MATERDHCELNFTESGGQSGSCSLGFSGSCRYSCSNGAWEAVENSCEPIPPEIWANDRERRILVNYEAPVTIRWNFGGYAPNQCAFTGAGLTNPGSNPAQSQTFPALSRSTYTIRCEMPGLPADTDSVEVEVRPQGFES